MGQGDWLHVLVETYIDALRGFKPAFIMASLALTLYDTEDDAFVMLSRAADV